MQIVGHGIDIVDTQRIEQMFDAHRQRFLDRCFTPEEQHYCLANDARRIEHLAGRFAAKEAIFKVLGTGWSGGIAWTDAQVVREPSGRPTVQLHGEAARVADALGIDQWWLSLSHIRTHATASAIGVKSGVSCVDGIGR